MVFYLKYTVDECLLLLVNSVHIFWSNSISKQGLTDVRKMLKYFVLMIKELYHPCCCKCNVHSLLHHVDFVEDHGPLFLFSCFWQKDFNEDLSNMFYGTSGVGFQVLTAIAISQKIPCVVNLCMELLSMNFTRKSKSKFKRVQWKESILQLI